MRASARSISRGGVFSVYFTNVRSTITRPTDAQF